MSDLTTTLAGVRLPSPVMTAAGCTVLGRGVPRLSDPAVVGAVVTRSVMLGSRAGAPMPRVAETPSGVLHASGLQGPGVDGFLATELPELVQQGARAVVSVAGATLGEYAELARRIGQSPGVTAVEVNLAWPHAAEDGLFRATDPYQTAKVLNVVRRDVPGGVPVLAKLAPDVGDSGNLVAVAEAAVEAGADALVVGGGALGLAIDPGTLRPALGRVTGGLGGPAVHPVALRCVWQVRRALPDVALVGVGGVRTGADVLAFLAVGASAVQVGTTVLYDPSAPRRITEELDHELDRRGVGRVEELVGVAHRPEGVSP